MKTKSLKHFCARLLAVAMAIAIAVPFMAAQETDVPAVTSFYPAKYDPPVNVASNTKVYTYFATGSKIVSNKARILQDGENIGTLTFVTTSKTNAYTTTTIMDQSKPENADINKVKPGLFSLEIYEVTYIADGVEKTYTATAEPLATVTYNRPSTDGKLVSETGIEDKLILSYWPADSENGVKTYTFDKPIVKENVNVYYEYGNGNYYFTTNLPFSVSDDGLTLTVDLRGRCYSSDVLAPGYTFLDDSGNPTDPPTTIALICSGLVCTDGSLIASESYSLDGQFHTTVRGKIHQAYNYQNLSFPTPVLSKVVFYNNASPAETYAAINETTDMFALTVEGCNYIASADIVLKAGDVTETIAAGAYTVSGNVYQAAIPTSIKAAGSKNLVISLDNVSYTVEDGDTHIILPLSLASGNDEVLNVADLKALEPETATVLNSIDGILITLSNDFGYTYGEDATGGIMILTPDYTRLFDEGVRVKGKIAGTYVGFDTFMIDEAASEYTVEAADVTYGKLITTPEELADETLNCRLVSIVASDDLAITTDGENIIIGSDIAVITNFLPDGYTVPGAISSVTGVLYSDANAGQTYVLVRTPEDIVADELTGIESIDTDNTATLPVYNINGIKVRNAGESLNSLPRGIYIVAGKKQIVK